jgi:pyridoxamine 5'-phosphate oxidase
VESIEAIMDTAETQTKPTLVIETDVARDPLTQFHEWWEQWASRDRADPTATSAVLATVDAGGQPSARLVDIARVDHGFVFFTNYSSRKGTDLASNPHAALCFAWLALARQVRIEGTVERLSDVESDSFFATLPHDVQLLSWASDQRQPIADQQVLVGRYAEIERRFGDQEVPRSRSWGGYRLIPDSIEFWQGRGDVHTNRRRYCRPGTSKDWIFEQLMP